MYLTLFLFSLKMLQALVATAWVCELCYIYAYAMYKQIKQVKNLLKRGHT